MYTEILHSTLIVTTLAISFLLSKTSLATYDLQISAFLFVIFFIGKKWLNKDKHRLIESLIFVFIINMIINTTGGIQSPFFFLQYFLLFSLSLFLEPTISVTTTIALIFFSLLSSPQTQNINQLLPTLSLAMITPFALFLGEEHLKEKQEARKNEILKNTLNNNKESAFLFLSLVLKNHIQNINQATENFLGDPQLDEIKKNVRRMKKLIEDYENQI